MFHTAPEGKTVKNRVHNNRWISWLDSEGNEFDLVEGG
jgi:hypothetical protein